VHGELRDPVGRDDASQRKAFADLLRDEGFEVIECTTAEAAELIIASTGTELRALITDQILAGAMSGSQLAQYARGRHPNRHFVRQDRDAYTGQHHVLTKTLHCRAVARSSPRLKMRVGLAPEIASLLHAFSPPLLIPCGRRRLNCRPCRQPSVILPSKR
jgi:hypothetical protein